MTVLERQLPDERFIEADRPDAAPIKTLGHRRPAPGARRSFGPRAVACRLIGHNVDERGLPGLPRKLQPHLAIGLGVVAPVLAHG